MLIQEKIFKYNNYTIKAQNRTNFSIGHIFLGDEYIMSTETTPLYTNSKIINKFDSFNHIFEESIIFINTKK